jgi:CDGSH iron-sulfur domain-containing protein 3
MLSTEPPHGGASESTIAMNEPKIAQKAPFIVPVEAGQTYHWCACGQSRNQPFCDGSHKGTAFAPIPFKAATTGKVAFCGCKHSKAGATCDGSHKQL